MTQVMSANTIDGNVGGNLNSALGGVQSGFGSGKGSTNWIDQPSGLYSTGDQTITVGGNTNLAASGLISSDGQVNLDTGTLTWSDFVGTQKYQGYQVNANIDLYNGADANGKTQNNSSAEGKYQLDDVEQSVKATISGSVAPGNITIRNTDQQASLEQSGQTGRVDQINSDPGQQNVVTKDKHIDLEPYVSVQSLQAAVAAGKTVTQAIGDAFDKMQVDGKISSNDNQVTRKILLNLNDKELRAALIGCAKQANGTGCSGIDSAYGTVSSDLARTLIGIVTVTSSEDKITVRETGDGAEGDEEIPESWEELKEEFEAENGPVLRTPITSPSQVTLPQNLSWLDQSGGIAVNGSGGLFRSVGTAQDGSEPVYEELGPSGESTGKYVTLDSGVNAMAVGGNANITPLQQSSTGPASGSYLYSVITEGGGLQAYEDAGGHLIDRHVGLSDAELANRLATSKISAASTFTDRVAAEAAVSAAIDSNRTAIQSYLSGASNSYMAVEYSSPTTVDVSLARGAATSTPVNNVRVVIVKDATMPTGYRIVTGYPYK